MVFLPLLAAAAGLLSQGADASPFTGTWVADLDTQQGLPTDVYLVRRGTYACESCTPPRHYPADGRMHAIGGATGTSESVRIVDARTILTHIIQSDLDRTTRMRVSRDGRTATYVSLDHRPGISGTLRTVYTARRTAPGPAGAHAVSGTWQGLRYVEVPLQLRTTILSVDAAGFSYRTGAGYAFTASFDGTPAPLTGPYDGSITVSLRRVDDHHLVETRRRGGVEIQTRTYTLSPDGRPLEIATTDLATHATFRITSRRRGVSRPL
jgi:hypothetical protein